MAYKGKITNIRKEHDRSDNTDFIDVEVSIFKDKEEEAVAVRRLSFPLSASEGEIKQEIQKYVDAFENDAKLAEQSAEVEELQKQADKTIKKLELKEFVSVRAKVKK